MHWSVGYGCLSRGHGSCREAVVAALFTSPILKKQKRLSDIMTFGAKYQTKKKRYDSPDLRFSCLHVTESICYIFEKCFNFYAYEKVKEYYDLS